MEIGCTERTAVHPSCAGGAIVHPSFSWPLDLNPMVHESPQRCSYFCFSSRGSDFGSRRGLANTWRTSSSLVTPPWSASRRFVNGPKTHNCFGFRLKRDAEWETCVPVAACGWKQTKEPVMWLYTKTIDGSTIEDKETTLVWCYEDADPDFGPCQAKELLDYLGSVLANEPVTVKSGPQTVEVKPQGVHKGLVAERLLETKRERGLILDFVLCIGDDRSDEDMFEVFTATDGHSLTPATDVFACTVGRKPSKAKYYLDDKGDILRLIKGLASVSQHALGSSSV